MQQRRDTLTVTAPVASASTQPEITWLPLSQIRRDGATQLRVKLDGEAVARYAQRWANGSVPPNVMVFYDGSAYWLGDGFHRVASSGTKELILQSLGNYTAKSDPLIPCDVRAGTRRDAQLFAASANRDHGVNMSDDDMRNAVDTLLRDEEWSKWSDREIARRVGCSPTTAGKRRALLAAEAEAATRRIELPLTVHVDSVESTARLPALSMPMPTKPTERTYERNGKTQTMQVANLQKPAEDNRPLATLNEAVDSIWGVVRYRAGIKKANSVYLEIASKLKVTDVAIVRGGENKRILPGVWEEAKESVLTGLQKEIEGEVLAMAKAAKAESSKYELPKNATLGDVIDVESSAIASLILLLSELLSKKDLIRRRAGEGLANKASVLCREIISELGG